MNANSTYTNTRNGRTMEAIAPTESELKAVLWVKANDTVVVNNNGHKICELRWWKGRLVGGINGKVTYGTIDY